MRVVHCSVETHVLVMVNTCIGIVVVSNIVRSPWTKQLSTQCSSAKLPANCYQNIFILIKPVALYAKTTKKKTSCIAKLCAWISASQVILGIGTTYVLRAVKNLFKLKFKIQFYIAFFHVIKFKKEMTQTTNHFCLKTGPACKIVILLLLKKRFNKNFCVNLVAKMMNIS